MLIPENEDFYLRNFIYEFFIYNTSYVLQLKSIQKFYKLTISIGGFVTTGLREMEIL